MEILQNVNKMHDVNPGLIYYTTTCFHLQVTFFNKSIDYSQFIFSISQNDY